MAYPNCSLNVNRQMLDPSFESYRLSLDSVPCYTVQLDAAVAEVKLKDSQYTLDHMKAFGMYNYLHIDPWYEESVYFVDCKGRVLNLTVTLDTALGKPREVFRMDPEAGSPEGERLCASLSLTSATWAALSDGAGTLTLLRTSKRGESSHLKWEPVFSECLGEPFTILHSVCHVQHGIHAIELLLLRLQKDPDDTRGSGFSTSLEWLTVSNSASLEKKYEVRKRRLMKGNSVPHYAALGPQGKGLMVASEKPFSFQQVDGVPLVEARAEPMQVDSSEPIYVWQQTAEDVTVRVRLPEGTGKGDVRFELSADRVCIGLRGGEPLLEGPLCAPVDAEASTWTIGDDESLEVTLQKRIDGPLWSEVVLGDKRGQCLINTEQATHIHQGLSHLTAEDPNANPEKDKPPCNAQELEDCDRFPEDSSTLMRFDGDTLKPTHVVNLASHQYLFTADTSPSEMPALCLRHDVDALLWQPRPECPNDMWEHVATFNALGYVQASKRDKKFATCAPNFSYAALAECMRRVFIYRQPLPVDTVLFNRKQGRQVGQVAKQQVASLESNEPVLGFRATNERLFVLTSSNLFVLKVNN
ncbi:nudC domain-containing protein 1 isoform X1 [Electrophorus electricus]|uniref:nudC domain-containing protein 1 isoform X1 n=1 Tax=Electrophorus electricus TaxID=8005 RepID=UPI0015D09BB5|nr:nudC domain-containing protein 1 isoform X1 [Electrophorus electricus]